MIVVSFFIFCIFFVLESNFILHCYSSPLMLTTQLKQLKQVLRMWKNTNRKKSEAHIFLISINYWDPNIRKFTSNIKGPHFLLCIHSNWENIYDFKLLASEIECSLDRKCAKCGRKHKRGRGEQKERDNEKGERGRFPGIIKLLFNCHRMTVKYIYSEQVNFRE